MARKIRFIALLAMCAALSPTPAPAADDPEEFLVTASRTDKTVIPGASLQRPADFLLQRIRVSSDSPDANVRADEILRTLRQLQNAARRDRTLELCALFNDRAVAPLIIDPATLKLRPGSRSQTTEVTIAVKTKVVPGANNATALLAKLKAFPTTVQPAGRSAIDVVGDGELTIVNPSQYRETVIQLYAADIKAVTSALGTEYRVVSHGIDRQLQWMRDGMTDVVFFIPYQYDVIPVNVTSYSHSGN
jgi:hypothetical protein